MLIAPIFAVAQAGCAVAWAVVWAVAVRNPTIPSRVANGALIGVIVFTISIPISQIAVMVGLLMMDTPPPTTDTSII